MSIIFICVLTEAVYFLGKWEWTMDSTKSPLPRPGPKIPMNHFENENESYHRLSQLSKAQATKYAQATRQQNSAPAASN